MSYYVTGAWSRNHGEWRPLVNAKKEVLAYADLAGATNAAFNFCRRNSIETRVWVVEEHQRKSMPTFADVLRGAQCVQALALVRLLEEAVRCFELRPKAKRHEPQPDGAQ